MSFRGRYPTKFRRSGNFRGHERFSFKERGHSFKRKYHEDRESPERFRERVPKRGRGRQVEKERDFFSDRGRGRPFKKHFSDRGMRPPRSRGRFFRGRQGHFRGGRGRRFGSPREVDRERSYERSRPPTVDWPEEDEFLEDEMVYGRSPNPDDEWDEYNEEDEYYNSEEDHIPFEGGLRSPLTIHRRFDNEEFDESPERSRSPLRRSRSLERRSFSGERENSFERLRSPVERFEGYRRRRDSRGSSHSIERSGNYREYRRSHSIEERERYVKHQRSVSPKRRKSSIDYDRHSFDRSPTPPRTYGSRERSFQGSEGERSITGCSRRSLERQIAFEKERYKKMLEHEKKCHEKRSESSIERFLDDCKKSFENKIKSPTNSRSNSFERVDYVHRRDGRSFERSLSPLDHPRTFSGLENITIERGRSLERSHSPIGRRHSFERRGEFSPERHRSPSWRKNYRNIHQNHSDTVRRSRSPEIERRMLMRNLSPEVSYDSKAGLSSTNSFRERHNFLEDREMSFLEDRERPFLGQREGLLLREQGRPFLGEQERGFIPNKPHNEEDLSFLTRSSKFETRERSFERQSLNSASHSRSFKERDHFLGVGDGPFSENRSISKYHKENYNRHNKNESSKRRRGPSPVLQPTSFDKTKISETNLELSPVSQSGSLEVKECSDYHEVRPSSRMDISPISQTGTLGKIEFSQENKNDTGLSPISQTESFGKVESGTERPNSTDSMQQFLAELENDDKCTGEKCHQENVQSLQNSYDCQIGGLNKHTADGKSISSSNDTIDSNRFNRSKHNNMGISRKNIKDIPQKSSYYDFQVKYDSILNKTSDKPLNENNEQEELFNAYGNSFLDQTCDAYNENLFQGRFEKSSKAEKKLFKRDKQVSPTHEFLLSPLNSNKTTNSSIPVISPLSHHILSRPPHNQKYVKDSGEISSYVNSDKQYLTNQNPQNPNVLYSGSNIRPIIMPFLPNQMAGPVHPFHQIRSSLPVLPQQSMSVSNPSAQMLQPCKEVIESNLGTPMFPQEIDKIIETQNDWQNQNVRFHTSPENEFNSLKQKHHGKLNQSYLFPTQYPQNETFSSSTTVMQTGSLPFDAISQQQFRISKPEHFEKFSQNVNLGIQHSESQGDTQFQPWLAKRGGPNLSSTNLPSGDKYKKTPARPRRQHNVKEIIVISDDEGQGKNYNDDSDALVVMSNGVFIPTAKVIEKYKNCPPTYDILGKILRGFVIYFGIKENSELQKDPIEVLQDSFSSSDGFEGLDIEEKTEYKLSSEPKQVCELRWKGLLLSRGTEGSREEARHVAGIALINALAKTCYTVQTKYGYYNGGRCPKFMMKQPEKPGYYKIVKRDEIIKSVTEIVKKLRAQGFAKGVDATHVNAVLSFMDEFFQDQETHCELIFGPSTGMEYTLGELDTIARHAYDKGLQYRWFHGNKRVKVQGKFVCVSRFFSPQALQRYLMAEGGDTPRYRLFPPQGPEINLLTASNVYSANMVKTIPPMTGRDQSLNFDSSKKELSFEDLKNPDCPTQSDMDPSQKLEWCYAGDDRSSEYKGNAESYYDSELQSSSHSQDLRFQGPSRPINTESHNPVFDKLFPGYSHASSNSFVQDGYKRNDLFQGSGDGMHEKWA